MFLWIVTNTWYRVDMVLLSGDFANIPVECYDNKGPQELFDEHRQHMEKIVLEFAPVSSKVYYVPGNVSSLVMIIVLMHPPSSVDVIILSLIEYCNHIYNTRST